MAKVCEICGKGPTTGRTVTRRGMAKRKGGVGRKIVRASKRRFLPNIKKVKAIVGGTRKKIAVCVECLKSGRVKKAI